MSTGGFLTLLGITLLAHVFLAFFSSIETINYPLISKSRKVSWLAFIWLIPIVGSIWVHKELGFKWGSGSSGGGDPTIAGGGSGGHDGGGCDGGGAGGGDCG